MTHRLEHALIILRDLRRSKSDVLLGLMGRALEPPQVESLSQGIAALDTAIMSVKAANKFFAAAIDLEQPGLVTEAMQKIGMQELPAGRKGDRAQPG